MAQKQERYEHRLDRPLKATTHFTTPSTLNSMSATTMAPEDEIVAELDEPPEDRNDLSTRNHFHRSAIRPGSVRKESLLTRALQSSAENDTFHPDINLFTDLGRPRSTHSCTSTASSVGLTSDGDLTSPAPTNSPSPPFPSLLDRLNIASKTDMHILDPLVRQPYRELDGIPRNISAPVKAGTTDILTKKRCITFAACGGQKPPSQLPLKLNVTTMLGGEKNASPIVESVAAPQKRTPAIKFACPPLVKKEFQVAQQPVKSVEPRRHPTSQSPIVLRKSRCTSSPHPPQPKSFTSTRRTSKSPLATRRKRPAFLVSNQNTRSSEVARFHEFASEEVVEDDWIRRDSSENKTKITISDTLRKENAIRQLGKEAEEEALQEEDDDDEDDHAAESDDNDPEDNSNDGGSDVGESDGNETDNEAGFAKSDDESDSEEFQFWAPRGIISSVSGEARTYRTSAHKATSDSSLDSPRYLGPTTPSSDATGGRPKSARRPKIRPGTPDLPDSTDFVCGTLDEDRPLEEAYLSCLEVRRRERHIAVPQDIDPSFPTSEPEDDDDEDELLDSDDSDGHVFVHGKFEDSDDHAHVNWRSRARKSPVPSPKRMHSPPPKTRLRSPPPRRLYSWTSPKRLRSPPVAHQVDPDAASPPPYTASRAITFTPLGQRPGLTHTKSLPRTPNAFCNQYRAIRLAAANAHLQDEETPNGYTRGAIDIVKGLERKRQHRKEKLLRKQNNRARKCGPERKPQPGKGAERMRELGLHIAGKGKATYVLSI